MDILLQHKPESHHRLLSCSKNLTQEHITHLAQEGFTPEQIGLLQQWGVRSLSQAEAEKMGFRVKGADGIARASSGLYFPFANYFGQIRADQPPRNSKGKLCKYLTPLGAKSEAWLPPDCKVVTEGFKDAAAGTLHGEIPTGALAGVSHYRKALPEGAGYTILFDADGWHNPAVFANLVDAGVYLKGKIQLVPELPGEPKAGLCEYFKTHTAEDYKTLIDSAMTVTAFLLALPDHWSKLTEEKKADCARKALVLAARHLREFEQEQLIQKIRQVMSLSLRVLKAELLKARRKAKGREARKVKSVPKQTGLIPIELDNDEKPILPASSFVANTLAAHYRPELAWNIEQREFYRYASEFDGQWSSEPLEMVRGMIAAELNSSGASDLYSAGYITSVCELLKSSLAVKHWNETGGSNLLPLRNGVLEISTGNLLTHSAGYRFLWQLPYAYNFLATCQPIQDWLLEAQDGDLQRVQLLRAYLKAIVTGRTDFQRYLECLGPGGTGKSTYTRLAIALVGLENTCITELKLLEGNRFETSGIYGKRLVVINDSERYGGSVSVLKAITGQDPLRNEQKHKQQGCGFVPTALVLVAANEAIQSNDYTSGLERRRLTIPFLNQVAASQRRDLLTITSAGMSGEFVGDLPGLLNWVLALPDEEMWELLVNTSVSVPSLAQWKAQSLLASNPIAEWLDTRIIIAAGEKTYVGYVEKIRETSGDPGNSASRDRYLNSDRWLYASYVQYCHQVGNCPISLKRFVLLLEDLLRSQLGIPIIKGRDRNGSFLGGIAIRTHEDDGSPRPITKAMHEDASVRVAVINCDGSVTAETPVDVGCDGCDGLLAIGLNKTCNSDEEQITTVSLNSEPGANESDENPSHPSQSTLIGVSANTQPVTTPTTDHLLKPPHALVNGCWRDDSDPFWNQLPATEGTSTVTRKNRALQIRKAWLAAKSGDELKKLKQRWSEEAKFVWNRVLTPNEQNRLKALAESRQISISDIPKDEWSVEELANVKAMWDSDESLEARRGLLEVFPLAVLERAIPTLELKRVS